MSSLSAEQHICILASDPNKMPSNVLSFAAAAALLSGAAQAQYLNTTSGPGYISYSTVTGYFLQDEPDTVASGFDYVSDNSEVRSDRTDLSM